MREGAAPQTPSQGSARAAENPEVTDLHPDRARARRQAGGERRLSRP